MLFVPGSVALHIYNMCAASGTLDNIKYRQLASLVQVRVHLLP